MSFTELSNFLFSWLRESWGILISLGIILFMGFDTSVITWKVILGVFLIIGIVTFYSAFNQKLYRNEKLSNILPYENLNSVFSIIGGFLLFRDASVFSFCIALVTFVVILAFSVDFKKLTLPKSIKTILLIQLLIALEIILTGWFLQSVPDKEYYILYEVLVVFILLFPILFKGSFKELKKATLPFYGYLMGGALTSHVAWLLYLFTVGEFGVVMSVLLSFLGTGITMLFGWLFLKEKPTKKNIWMSMIVAVLVILGFIVG